jgi:hypothetical protein
MKQLIITLAVVISGFFNNANATDSVASPGAIAAFQKQFARAKEVLWEDFGSLYKVSFEQDGRWASAYYDEEGLPVTIVRNVSLNELPSALRNATRKQMNNYWITNLVLMTGANGKGYYITFENAMNKIIMRSVNNRKWTLYQNIEK